MSKFLFIFSALIFPALLAIPIAVFSDISVYVGLVGLGAIVGGLVIFHFSVRGQGNSGYIGLLFCFIPPLIFVVANFLAALVKFLAGNITVIWGG